MALRNFRERVLQTLCFEGGGLLMVAPGYALVTGHRGGASFVLMTSISVAVMVWSPIHNIAFDVIDLRLTGRVASDRPHGLRIVHATSHEVSAVVVSLPILVWLGGHSVWAALAVDVTLTVVYTAYAYVFHLAYDRLRPVMPVLHVAPVTPENASTVSAPGPGSSI